MNKSIRFDPDLVEQITDFQETNGFNNFSSATKFLLKSALDRRSYKRRGEFIRCTHELLDNAKAINSIGSLLNQLVSLYARGQVPKAHNLNVIIQDLQDVMNQNLISISDLSNTIIVNS